MTRDLLVRIARMDRRELAWRTRAAARIAAERVRASVAPPQWDRRDLLPRLARTKELGPIRTALRERRWHDAHVALSAHFATRASRFVIAPAQRSAVRRRVRGEFPDSAPNAVARADRLLHGEYDLLGYRGLRFDRSTQAGIEWHRDPVHGRQAPQIFWADVPYLDPVYGDHKIIWELNRHQHWLPLGRAYWLTGDRRYRDRFLSELISWIDANPPLTGVNWASMLELAFRSLSWVWALHFFVEDRPEIARAEPIGAATPWTVDLLLGLDRQLTHVEHNLSHYFSPNTHLLGEALALYVAGRALPELARSGRREAIGRQVLVAEMERQIAGDGGHCERSTHYHRYALDFYLLALVIARITGDPVAARFERAVGTLAGAARILADDDGRVAHIGDDDGGMLMPIAGRAVDDWRDSLAAAAALLDQPDLRIGSVPEEPFWLLADPALAETLDRVSRAPAAGPVGSAALPETGYYVSRAHGDHLVIDGGPHGYQNAGHAHADALSLVFTRRGVPLLIDAGTGCYTIDPDLRDRMRSTKLHNTLTLDGRDQSTPRGPFHWQTTADATVHRWRANGRFDYFDGSHDGYRPMTHRRHVLALHDDLLIVADLVSGPEAGHLAACAAAVHWHVDPRWRVDATGDGARITDDRQEQVSLHAPNALVECIHGDPATGLGWHAPIYGRIEPATTIQLTQRAVAPLWIVSVFGLDAENAVSRVETLPVWAEAGVLAQSMAVRITRRSSVDYALLAEPAAPAPGTREEPRRPPTGLTVRGDQLRTWRVAELETDARLLFCRTTDDQGMTHVALVDGSFVRLASRPGAQIALPGIVSDLYVDVNDGHRAASAGTRL